MNINEFNQYTQKHIAGQDIVFTTTNMIIMIKMNKFISPQSSLQIQDHQ